MSKIVIALGGNALGKNPSEQLSLLKDVAKIIVDLVKDGNKIILTHGNGPQVGQIALAMEYASNGEAGTPMMPFPECGSMSQGYIGYQLQQCIQNELKKQNISKNCVTLITQVLVDSKDSAFQNPSKPIGMFYTKEEALDIEKEKGYTMIEDAGRGYRRVVPSPMPIDIVEKNTIKMLFDNNNIVIASGGGGIPVILDKGAYKGVEDKLSKLEKYFTPDTDVFVTLSVEKERQKIEVTIPVKGNIIRSEQVSNDMYVSIDLVEEVIERQLKKYKNKLVSKQQNAASFRKEFIEKEVSTDDEIQIIRTKRFGMKPMYPEDACVQMELLGHNFFVFRNAETEEVNVVYKRKGNTYGLIEPEF